ncbi:hypothetical protein PFISCL1PPCAC_23274, partial [Pristionchus fissidentatus]
QTSPRPIRTIQGGRRLRTRPGSPPFDRFRAIRADLSRSIHHYIFTRHENGKGGNDSNMSLFSSSSLAIPSKSSLTKAMSDCSIIERRRRCGRCRLSRLHNCSRSLDCKCCRCC